MSAWLTFSLTFTLNRMKGLEKATFSNQYTIFCDVVSYLESKGAISDDTVVRVSSGEFTVNTDGIRLVKQLKNYPVEFYTNAYIYSPEAAEVIESSGMIFCDTDAGTAESFRKVKGVDGFARVSENLREYAKHGPVCMKYILLDGYNDSPEDLEGFFELADEVAVRVALTRDHLKPSEVFSDRALRFAAKFIRHFQQLGKINIDLNLFAHDGERERLDRMLEEG